MKYRSTIIIILYVMLVISGCSLFSEYDDLRVRFPEYTSSWKLLWLADTNNLEESTFSGTEVVNIKVAREIPLLAAAWPVDSNLSENWAPKPAGYIAGLQIGRPGAISLNWTDGFGAQLLLELARNIIDLRRFNVERFARTLRDMSQEDNLWNIDIRLLFNDLINKDFWIYSIKFLEPVDVKIPLPPGTWQADYLELPPVTVGENGLNTLLTVGMHSFLNKENNMTAQVWISSKENPVIWIE